MDEPIEDAYFNWLYSKVASVDVPTPSLTHYKLLRELHSIEFVWLVRGDDNRAEEGLDVRREFLRQSRMDCDPTWIEIGCSVLEMLIAFARRAEFQTDVSARDWFWIFMTNLGLNELNDSHRHIRLHIQETVERLVWRTYDPSGHGGLFPLNHAQHDQRKVEIWYQFCEYLIEQEQ